MNEITRVGVDLAKRVIQIHAVDSVGRTVSAKPLPRDKFLPWCTLHHAKRQAAGGCKEMDEAQD